MYTIFDKSDFNQDDLSMIRYFEVVMIFRDYIKNIDNRTIQLLNLAIQYGRTIIVI